MNGLEYICIRWNFSQSFLAEMLGVTRQAISQWFTGETKLSNKRIVMLMDFFGLDSDLFGELTSENKGIIDKLPVYHHMKNGHEFYLHRIDQRYINETDDLGPIPCILNGNFVFLPDNKGNFSDDAYKPSADIRIERLATVDEKLNQAVKELNALMDRARKPINDSESRKETRLNYALHVLDILKPAVDVNEKIRSIKDSGITPFKVIYDCAIEDFMAGLGLAFGTMDEDELPNDFTEKQDGLSRAYGRKAAFAKKVAALLTAEIIQRSQTLVQDQGNKLTGYPDIKHMGSND